MATIKSKVIGLLQKDEKFDDCWVSEAIEIPFFEMQKIPFVFMNYIPDQDPNFIHESNQALKAFLSKGIEEKYLLSKVVHTNCMDLLKKIAYDNWQKQLYDIVDHNHIWKYVYPKQISVMRDCNYEFDEDRNDMDIYVQVCCECEWEEEHGLQLVFNRGIHLTRISTQDGEFY